MPTRKTYLFAAVIKKDNFEFIVEKATELGVTDIIPIIADHSEKKALNRERLIKISIEASEQSGRGDVPKIHSITPLKDFRRQILDSRISNLESILMIAFHTDGEFLLRSDLSESEPVAIFIGPEAAGRRKK